MDTIIYLDNNATTPVDPEVFDAMVPYLKEHFGNASSKQHSIGWRAEDAAERSRSILAEAIGAQPEEIVFTSGATEANNLAIRGVAQRYRRKGNHIVTAAAEHKAVLTVCETLVKDGFEVTVLSVDRYGRVDPEEVRKKLRPETILATFMFANNEVGTVNDISAIGGICREAGVIFHTDATQALGKVPIDVEAMNIDLASFSAHKIYGPKGCGALFVRKKGTPVELIPLIVGGGQERGMRAGTLNVPGIVGMAKAVEISLRQMHQEQLRIRSLRDLLYDLLTRELDLTQVNGHPEHRLAGTLNMTFRYVDAAALMSRVRNIAMSSSSACTSGTPGASHVLRAIGLTEEEAKSSIRFSIGRFNTEDEIRFAAAKIIDAVKKIRAVSPAYLAAESSFDASIETSNDQ